MANDIDNAHSSNTDIKVGTVIVQGTKANIGNKNFTGSATDTGTAYTHGTQPKAYKNSDSEYTSYTRNSGNHSLGIQGVQSKYDTRFDDPNYYSA